MLPSGTKDWPVRPAQIVYSWLSPYNISNCLGRKESWIWRAGSGSNCEEQDSWTWWPLISWLQFSKKGAEGQEMSVGQHGSGTLKTKRTVTSSLRAKSAEDRKVACHERLRGYIAIVIPTCQMRKLRLERGCLQAYLPPPRRTGRHQSLNPLLSSAKRREKKSVL